MSVSGLSGVKFSPGCHTMRTISVNTTSVILLSPPGSLFSLLSPLLVAAMLSYLVKLFVDEKKPALVWFVYLLVCGLPPSSQGAGL